MQDEPGVAQPLLLVHAWGTGTLALQVLGEAL
jgi:hypothetical protein